MQSQKITIEMTTGNEFFKTRNDVALALRMLALKIELGGVDSISRVKDENGNTVGTISTEKV